MYNTSPTKQQVQNNPFSYREPYDHGIDRSLDYVGQPKQSHSVSQASQLNQSVLGTPIPKQSSVPVWMYESPGDLSILDSPLPSQFDFTSSNGIREITQ